MKNIDLENLIRKAKFYTKELWGMELDIPIKFNGRLVRMLGYLSYTKQNEPERIEIAKKLLDECYNRYRIDDVLVHELCHWYCSKTGKQSKDGSIDFENELKKVGASTTRSYFSPGKFYTTECSKCKESISKNRTYQQMIKYTKRESPYRSNCCKEHLIEGKIIYIQDEFIPTEKLKALVNKFDQLN